MGDFGTGAHFRLQLINDFVFLDEIQFFPDGIFDKFLVMLKPVDNFHQTLIFVFQVEISLEKLFSFLTEFIEVI